MEMTTAKTIGVFFVIFGCFAILYPKIFHPMVVQIFGLTPKRVKTPGHEDLHPRDRMPRPAVPSAGPGSPANDAMRSHMRAGMHPGMRAAAEMKKQAAEQGSSKGMMGMILPMYAVGIIIYLVYTMTKVFMKNNKNNGDNRYNNDPYSRYMSQELAGGYDRQDQFQADLADDTDFLLSKKEKLEELEQLLAKAEERKMNDTEMRLLKDRLHETESQMARILKAMESVQSRVKDGLEAKIAETDAEKTGGEKIDAKEDGLRRKVQASCDSSPDMESYEIIGKGRDQGIATEKKKSERKVESEDAMNTDLDALDSESSGRESDDEDSESVGLDDMAPNMIPGGTIVGGIGAGLGIGVAMNMSSDPSDMLGMDAREVEVVGSLGRAFNVSGDDTDNDGSDEGEADYGDGVDNDNDDDDDDDDGGDYDSEPPVEAIDGDSNNSGEKPEGLRKRQAIDRPDS